MVLSEKLGISILFFSIIFYFCCIKISGSFIETGLLESHPSRNGIFEVIQTKNPSSIMASSFSDRASTLQGPHIPGLERNNGIQMVRDERDATREQIHQLQWALDDTRREVEAAHEKVRRMQLDVDMGRSQAMRHVNTIESLKARIAELEVLVEQQKLMTSNPGRTIEEIQVQQHVSPGQLLPVTPQNPGHGVIGYQGRSAGAPSPPTFFTSSSAPPRFNRNVYNQTPVQFGASTNNTMGGGPASQATPANQMPTFAHDNIGNVAMESQAQVVNAIPDPFVSGENQIQAPQIITDVFGSVQLQTQALQTIPDLFGLTHPYDFEKGALEFERRFAQLWIKTQQFGELQANVPNVQRDKALDRIVKDYIMKVSSQRTASRLLFDSKTRCVLVTKAIAFYIVEEVLKLTTVSGFDKDIDAKVANCFGQLHPGMCSSSCRNIDVFNF